MGTEDYSVYSGVQKTLGTLDYIVFSTSFLFSAAVGFYHAVKDRRQNTVENFHLANRNMHVIPVTMSMAATAMTPMTMIAMTTEIYTYGTMISWLIMAGILGTFISAHLLILILYNLHKTSCFEYLNMRFGKQIRILASVGYLLVQSIFMAFVLYVPALTLTVVTGMSLWGCLVGIIVVCTLYTTLGGMKTVIWTDTLQYIIIVAGLLSLLILGAKDVGGLGNAWEIASRGGRIHFNEFSPDPRIRHTVWNVSIGGGFLWIVVYGINQAQVQRACTLPSMRKVKQAVWMGYIIHVAMTLLIMMTGVVMFAAYSECHPVKYGIIKKSDQLITLFVLDVLAKYPGLSGLFVASIFSGTLSTTSSILSAFSAIIMEDLLKSSNGTARLTERHGIFVAKVIVIISGMVLLGLAVAVSSADTLIFQFSFSLFAMFAGPLLGMFVCGMFFPWVNHIGAIVGFCVSFVCMVWLCYGSITSITSASPPLPVSTSGCRWNATNSSSSIVSTFSTSTMPASVMSTNSSVIFLEERDVLDDIYSVSYMLLTCIGMLVNIILSLAVSFITGHTQPRTLDIKLICPVFDIMFPFLHERIRRPLRFGVVYNQPTITTKWEIKEDNEKEQTPQENEYTETYKF